MDDIKAKGIVASFFAVSSYVGNSFNELFVIWFYFTLIDYISGSVAAKLQGKWTRREALWGAIGKCGMGLIILMGFLLDFSVTYLARYVKHDLSTNGYLGLGVICWFIGTEGISSLKNFRVWRVDIPPFLKKAFGKMKKSAGNGNK